MPSDSDDSKRSHYHSPPIKDKDARILGLENWVEASDQQHAADCEDWRRQRIRERNKLFKQWREERKEDRDLIEKLHQSNAEVQEQYDESFHENERLKTRVTELESQAKRHRHRRKQLRELHIENFVMRTPRKELWERRVRRLRVEHQNLKNSIEAQPITCQIQLLRRRVLGLTIREDRRVEIVAELRQDLQSSQNTIEAQNSQIDELHRALAQEISRDWVEPVSMGTNSPPAQDEKIEVLDSA